jgi:hypothetical protein
MWIDFLRLRTKMKQTFPNKAQIKASTNQEDPLAIKLSARAKHNIL